MRMSKILSSCFAFFVLVQVEATDFMHYFKNAYGETFEKTLPSPYEKFSGSYVFRDGTENNVQILLEFIKKVDSKIRDIQVGINEDNIRSLNRLERANLELWEEAFTICKGTSNSKVREIVKTHWRQSFGDETQPLPGQILALSTFNTDPGMIADYMNEKIWTLFQQTNDYRIIAAVCGAFCDLPTDASCIKRLEMKLEAVKAEHDTRAAELIRNTLILMAHKQKTPGNASASNFPTIVSYNREILSKLPSEISVDTENLNRKYAPAGKKMTVAIPESSIIIVGINDNGFPVKADRETTVLYRDNGVEQKYIVKDNIPFANNRFCIINFGKNADGLYKVGVAAADGRILRMIIFDPKTSANAELNLK